MFRGGFITRGKIVDFSAERRRHRRFVYEAQLSHDILAHNNIYKGKLYNFSKVGLYFESDQTIFPGEEVFIKFEGQQESINQDVMAQLPFGVEIVWRKDLPDSSFRYGYGANYIDINDSLVKSLKILKTEQQNSQNRKLDAEKDPREYPRRLYRKTLLLSYKCKNYKAEFKDISRGGVFIKTDIRFTVGKQIRIAVPGSEFRKDYKLKGWIVRINTEGFGVKFDSQP
jgi:Tfp pilus assembly protein PilZ